MEKPIAPLWQKRIGDDCYDIIVLHAEKEEGFDWQVRVSRPDPGSADGCGPDDIGMVLDNCKGNAKTQEEAFEAARECLNEYLISIGESPV